MDAKTQQDIRKKCYTGEIKDIYDYEFEFPSMVKNKKYQWPLTKNENIQATSDQCATCQMKSSELQGKVHDIMDQINKTDINDISISYVHEKIT